MQNDYVLQFFNEQEWSPNVKREFTISLRLFMAKLTENAYKRRGTTKLYIPKQESDDLANFNNDSELQQRIDNLLTFWINQIKDVTTNTEANKDQEDLGPLEEIKYWGERKKNLQYINKQLESDFIKRVRELHIQKAKDFNKHALEILRNAKEADNNLTFLEFLKEPCQLLSHAKPEDIPLIIPDLLIRIRIIWDKCVYYQNFERICSLLKKISNEIIRRCISNIDVNDMFEGDVEHCKEQLQKSIKCCEQWFSIYQNFKALVDESAGDDKSKMWDFNSSRVFAKIDAFKQRCNYLIDICLGQL